MSKGKMPTLAFYQSHRDDTRKGDEAPPEPHLAVRANPTAIMPIAPGTHMFIVVDPRRVDGYFEMVFEKVKLKQGVPIELHFKVPDNTATRKIVMTIGYLGRYDSWLKAEQERVTKEEEAKKLRPNPACKFCQGMGEVLASEDGPKGTGKSCINCWE